MDPDIKDEWLDRLRSGDYEQTTGQLRDNDNGRCCLGVLCDIYAEQNDDGEWDDETFVTSSDADRKVLPSPVVNWASLMDYQGERIPVDKTHVEEGGPREFSLSMLNDGLQGARQHTFDEIADLIEQNL
jgi:hypothetical protein